MEGFTGERIVLRKAKPGDLEAIHENVFSDKELLATMFVKPSESLEETRERLPRTIEFQRDKLCYFIALKDTDEAIGLCGIMEESEGVWSESGLCIARKYQGRGYAAEMWKILLDYGFSECGAETFAYYCMDTNVKSKNLALKFGFRYDSTDTETRSYDGAVFNIERYLLKKEDYLKNEG